MGSKKILFYVLAGLLGMVVLGHLIAGDPDLIVNVDVQLAPDAGAEQRLADIRRLMTGGITPSAKPGDLVFSALSEYGVRRIRFINIEWDTRSPWGVQGVRKILWSPKLKSELALCKRYGWQPHIVIGQTAPGHPDGREVQGENFDWAAYRFYLESLFDYVTKEWKFDSVVWEVGNEFDNPKVNWPARPLMNRHLDEAGYQGYLRLFKEISEFASDYQRTNPSVKMLLGGPALTQNSMNYRPGHPKNWNIRFIKDVARLGLRCDFFSMHFYGGDATLQQFHEGIGWLRSEMQVSGVARPLWITEWGASAFFLKGEHANFAPIAGAFSLEFANQAARAGIDEMLFIAARQERDTSNNGPSWFDRDGAPTHTLKAIEPVLTSRGKGRECRTDDVTVSCLAFMEDNLLHVLVWQISWNEDKVGNGPKRGPGDVRSLVFSLRDNARTVVHERVMSSVNGGEVAIASSPYVPKDGYAHYQFRQ